jgi:hypothetical protein
MSISHTPDGIVVSDDQDPGREPMVLSPGATPQQIDAALLEYFGPERLRQPPDYVGFYGALKISSVYENVLLTPATAGLARAMTVFVSVMQDCMSDREDRSGMQTAIWLLLSELPLNPAHAMELHSMMVAHNLAEIYSLQPPPST